MPRRLLYGLPDALRADGFSPIPSDADIAKAIRSGLLPWIDIREGRPGFDESNLPKIAAALGLKVHAPEPKTAPSGIDGVIDKFNALFK